jgi:hypothetical protein
MKLDSLIQPSGFVAAHRIIALNREAYRTASRRKRPPPLLIDVAEQEEEHSQTARQAGHQGVQTEQAIQAIFTFNLK